MIELNKTYQDKSGNSVRIICVDRKNATHPILGLVNEADIRGYTTAGKIYSSCPECNLIIPEDYSTYVIDEPVMVRDGDDEDWQRGHFAGMRDGSPCAFGYGATAWSNDSCLVAWNQCRRPTKEELGEK